MGNRTSTYMNSADNAAKSMPPVPAPKNTLNSVPNKHMLRPYFEDVGSRNLTAVVGQVVILKCRVKQLGERTVSWMRKRDLHILTTNIYTYTGDARFSVIHPQNSDEWNMKIDYAQKRDAGIYECQVNTEPKMNMAIMLNVDDRGRPVPTCRLDENRVMCKWEDCMPR
ncbi:uncharacterized protein LOC103524803 [Diaphorina citri]|uniref:Uncharacterized protein LOC103524803 n=1 Tax=Diaphorina citri TaxID=121845 RepID=A0A3Q0II72_DIACI|nr:uncharacterized protein LOC103524803 [Diaphorina citri]